MINNAQATADAALTEAGNAMSAVTAGVGAAQAAAAAAAQDAQDAASDAADALTQAQAAAASLAQIVNSIVSSWQATPDNDHIPTEKLVKDSLDAKMDDSQIVVTWQATPDNIHVPSEALTKNSLDAKVDDSQIVTSFQATPDNDHIPSEKLVADSFTDGSVTKVGTANVGTDTKPIKLVGGVPTAVTDDLVDTATAQTAGGAKTWTGQQIASGQRAYDPANVDDVVTIGSLQSSPDVVHTTGNENIAGIKDFAQIKTGILNNNYAPIVFPNNSKAKRVYEFNLTGAQYHSTVILMSPRRSNTVSKAKFTTGILVLTANSTEGAAPYMYWLAKGSSVNNNNFVVTREGLKHTFWVINTDSLSTSDGCSFIRLTGNSSAALEENWVPTYDSNEYTISSSGYTDLEGIVHTFDGYTTSQDI